VSASVKLSITALKLCLVVRSKCREWEIQVSICMDPDQSPHWEHSHLVAPPEFSSEYASQCFSVTIACRNRLSSPWGGRVGGGRGRVGGEEGGWGRMGEDGGGWGRMGEDGGGWGRAIM
jgi:hypothetical protein